DEGHAFGQEAMQRAEVVDHPFSLSFAALGLARLYSVRGELIRAARVLEHAVALCREWNFVILMPLAMASLGHVYASSGRITEGTWMLQQALTAFEAAGLTWLQSMSLVQLGEAYLLADRLEDARTCAHRALMLARERGESGHEAWALRLQGEIAAYHAGPDDA